MVVSYKKHLTLVPSPSFDKLRTREARQSAEVSLPS